MDENTRSLILDVLDRLADKAKIHSSSLVYLDHDFSADEIDQVNQFMMTQVVGDNVVSTKTLATLLQAVKPSLTPDLAAAIAPELNRAWLEEGMYKPILS